MERLRHDPATRHQLDMWSAYLEVEPFGERRADYRSGLAASVLGNVWVDGAPFKPELFDVESHMRAKAHGNNYERKAKSQIAKIRTIAAAQNARAR